jgi:DNA (cytosine-5)-methyltransferase 1
MDPKLVRSFTALDLFSGAGGFTEGFRQSGIDMVAALDNWGPAADTHLRNHPKTEMFREDILEFDPSDFRKVDVLIGSPPCTQFSYSNKGGGGDISLGMKFVLRFLRFVHELEPRYWVMENVPRLLQSLPERVPLRRLGLKEDGFLDIPVRRILNSADYGVPQKRLRLFSGKFPLPVSTHAPPGSLATFGELLPWRPAKDVLGGLPDPLARHDPSLKVRDPNFELTLPLSQVSDHLMDTTLTDEEVLINRKAKTDHSWYGRMAFPDPVDRPARTVMATQTGVSRETLVLRWQRAGGGVFRRPTIRECASFQSFPISYQFWGRSAETRYKLVGNAVPPLMAAAVARALLAKTGRPVPALPLVQSEVDETPQPVQVAKRLQGFHPRRFPADRGFRDHVPGSKVAALRVDFDNGLRTAAMANVRTVGAPPTAAAAPHLVEWTARLYIGSGKRVTVIVPTLEQAADLFVAGLRGSDREESVGKFCADLAKKSRSVPDASTLQAVWAGKLVLRARGPANLLWEMADLVDATLPPESFHDLSGPVPPSFPDLGRDLIPVRISAVLLAAVYFAQLANSKLPLSTAGRRALERFDLFEKGRLKPSAPRFDPPDLRAAVAGAMQRSEAPTHGIPRGAASTRPTG